MVFELIYLIMLKSLPTTPTPARIIAGKGNTVRVSFNGGSETVLHRFNLRMVTKKHGDPWLSAKPFNPAYFPKDGKVVIAKIPMGNGRRRLCWAPLRVWKRFAKKK